MLSYKPSTVGRFTKDDSLEDPWAKWKQKRKEIKHDIREDEVRHVLLRLFDAFVPAAASGIAIWAIAAYSITEEKAHETRTELERRRGTAPAT